MKKKNVKLWDRLKYRYKIAIINDTTYEEKFGARLSMLHGIITLSVIGVIVTSFTIFLIAFTNLKEFIPGYPSGQLRKQIVANLIRTDSLEYELYKRDQYIHGLKQLFGETSDPKAAVSQQKESLTSSSSYDSIQFSLTENESNFRSEIEEKERFNLSFGLKTQENEYYHFFPPVEGIVTRAYDEKARHYGTDIVAKQDAKVSSVLDGIVIFADWTVKTGYSIHVQHKNNLISIYKHNSVLLKQQGDYVRAGEVLALVGNTGEESSGAHLHFELWRAGNPLDPENFIKFK